MNRQRGNNVENTYFRVTYTCVYGYMERARRSLKVAERGGNTTQNVQLM